MRYEFLSQKGYLFLAIMIIFLFPSMLLSQNLRNDQDDFKIYMDVGKVNSSFSDFIKEHDFLMNKRLTMSMINPKRDGCAQLEVVAKYIDQIFPDKFAEELCVIDWEGKAIKNLKRFAKGDETEADQMQEYIKIVDTIRALRPNLKIGIYNIPFRNYSKHKVANNPYDYKRLYPLLKKVDYILPSPYKPYANKEVNAKLVKAYYEDYIEQSLRIKKDLNKPVLAYIAMRYYNSNSEYHKELIPEEEFKFTLIYMLDTHLKGKFIDGFILWNGDRWEFEQTLKNKSKIHQNKLNKGFLENHFDLIKKYTLIITALK